MYKPDGFVNLGIKFVISSSGEEIPRPIIGNKIITTIVEEGVLELIPV